jgi:hypothetical protein
MTSFVWNHFNIYDKDHSKAECKICGSLVSRGGTTAKTYTTSNMSSHLKIKHPTVLVKTETKSASAASPTISKPSASPTSEKQKNSTFNTRMTCFALTVFSFS